MFKTFGGKLTLHYAPIVFKLQTRINRVAVLKGFSDKENDRLGFCLDQ